MPGAKQAFTLGFAGCLSPPSRVPERDKPATGKGTALLGNFPSRTPDSPRLKTAAAPSHLNGFRLVWKALCGRDADIPLAVGRLYTFPGALSKPELRPLSGLIGKTSVLFFVAGGNPAATLQLHTISLEDLLT